MSRFSAASHQINVDLLRTLERPGTRYFTALAAATLLMLWGLFAWSLQIYKGMQMTGKMVPVMWGAYITTFVFWVGIAHSGTLVSAVLFLFRAQWRSAVSRSAEAMTVFAIMTAGLFPLIHLGRVWYFYWIIPYPNQRGLWVNFRSPLVWDEFAISTYLVVSVLFWYLGLIPDLASIRDASRGGRARIFGWLSLGWRGSAGEWKHYSAAYLFFAALATPLVISVHSVVSWDFAMGLVPGWHSTIFAPYFVAGAILSGLSMVLTLVIPARSLLGLESYITQRHLEQVAKLIILTSLIVTYAYVTEFFFAWYGENFYERGAFLWRAFGYYAPLFWLMVFCNSIVPLCFFFPSARRSTRVLLACSLLINVGMWTERFVIIVSSLSHDHSVASWGRLYWPSWVEWSVAAGSLGFFLLLFLLFIRHLPAIPMWEVKHEWESHDSRVPAGSGGQS
jgi:Ni/Fe-hydrogenase subunit HybB-like protein